MNPIVQRSGLSVVGLLVAGGCLAGTTVTAQAAAAATTPAGPVHTDRDGRAEQNGRADRRAERTVNIEYQAQPNFYYCGPAATRIALSAMGKALSQDEVAKKLGTTEAGTDSALDTTRVLNELTGGRYRTTEIPDPVARPAQVDRLRADVLAALDEGRPVVANVKGTAVDTDGHPQSYEGGHYLTLVGYRDGGGLIRIADPASPEGEYWMTLEKVANWIAERGYSS
ncbi:C39 family peptidase [Micromonospora peucetia]|uniref:C39 family peptidase n=1 Tax=Micromonospora peucetia TaxID=47871 RepID=A0A1C6UMI6_9ACTN|nr:C39 family peptidase [Micromonospora peucetia]MCX4387043.1 C39 family peptidase [Micromonospora peucetia]WSA34410.1 C39 family peptidase [Micromonospora peucetia]SCL55221.1 Peptidase_C39 like family protein [Micromonospora peucetia]